MTDRTFLDSLQRQMRERPDAPAYRCGERLLSFADIDRATNRVANALVAMGVGPGDRVACLTRHHIEFVLLMLGASKAGAVCMPVNWRLAADEVSHIVEHGGARFMMADEAFLPLLAKASLPSVRQIVCTEAASGGVASFADWYGAAGDRFDAVQADSAGAMLQLYSSGTTGLPKGIVLSHRGLMFAVQLAGDLWGMDAKTVNALALPTFHVAGATMSLATLHSNGMTLSYPDFDPAVLIDAIGRHGVTHAFLVPAMIMFMLQSPKARHGDFRTLKLIAYGGSPITEAVLTEAIEVLGCGFLQVYGLTEVSGPGTYLLPEDHRPSGPKARLLRSAGQAIRGARLRIVDPVTLKDLPDGESGEVWIESPGNMIEYWRNPEATAQAFPEGRNERGGWFRTGDAGYLEGGYLFINDRLKDMIISGGENIYPAEIENVLAKHPGVADGAIIGVPDDVWGELVKACVVRRSGSTVTEGEIIDYMRERLARFKCPKSVDFLDALPRNPSGKILKRLLREPYWKDKGRAVH